MVLWHERKFSAYCAVNIVGAAMCGQNPCPLNFDETNCLAFVWYPYGCLFVYPFVFFCFFYQTGTTGLRFYFVAESPQFCSYLSWDRPIRLTQCCTQFRSLGVKVFCLLHLHDNIAFTFK